MIKRLRPYPSREELAALYAVPHDARQFRDHTPRVDTTIKMGQAYVDTFNAQSIADLSCGNAAIADGIRGDRQIRLWLGDLAPGYLLEGPIEETLFQIPHVDLFVLSETLEHVEYPQTLLDDLRIVTSALLLSTPVGMFDDANEEHVWAWDPEGVESMTDFAGFEVYDYTEIDRRHIDGPYNFGIWLFR